MKSIKEMTEEELREFKVPTPKTVEELNAFINDLTERTHDYGTCVYAMSLSAVATFNYVASQLGVTGFQASCADLDFLKRIRQLEDGFRIIDYNKLLYPQYLTDEHFPSAEQLIEENKKNLKKRALQLLKKNRFANEDVFSHWKKLSKL